MGVVHYGFKKQRIVCLSLCVISILMIFLGGAGELIDRGDNTYGGKWVINPSGGLISKGHPLGATGKSYIYCYF